MSSMRDLKWQINEKEKELKILKEQREQMIKDKLLSSLNKGYHYEITDDESWSNYRTIYICKYDGENIHINKGLCDWKLFFDGPVIVKKVINSDNTIKTSYTLSSDEEMYVYDELYINPIDITEVKKVIRKIINQFQ